MSSPPSPAPAIHPLGEAAWAVVLGDRVDAAIHARVTALARRLGHARLEGVIEIVPAYATVTVFFDPARSARDLEQRIAEVAAVPPGPAVESGPPRSPVVIPVRYDGPDLAEVAARTGLSREEVIERHSAPVYRVYLLGFAPGWAYLGDLDPKLILPRRAEPRTRVPAGSVAIAGAQTGVYPLATPGGWHLIGSTTLRMFDPARTPPALLNAGDRVRFQPI